MKRILAVSDTHGYWDTALMPHIKNADEIWHAGDIGNIGPFTEWCTGKILRMVWGNIDTTELRNTYPETIYFTCELLRIRIIHIAGKPQHHTLQVKQFLKQNPTDILMCGHSHICQIAPNQPYSKWFINPGACGKEGFHSMRTAIRFNIQEAGISDVDVIELGKRALAK